MEFFVEQLRIVLPVLGLDLLKDQPKVSAIAATPKAKDQIEKLESPTFELISKKYDIRAEAREIDGDFVVFADSLAKATWIGVANHHYRQLHQQLIADGVLIPGLGDVGNLRFSHDYAFNSPSAASAVILGRADNGRMSWCVKSTKKTYANWQEEQIAAVTLAGNEE